MGELRDRLNSFNTFKKIPILKIKGLYNMYDVTLPLDGKLKVLHSHFKVKSTVLKLLWNMIEFGESRVSINEAFAKRVTLSNKKFLKNYSCEILTHETCNVFFEYEEWIIYNNVNLDTPKIISDLIETIPISTKLQVVSYYNHYLYTDRIDIRLPNGRSLQNLSDSEKWLFYLYYKIGYRYRNENFIALIDNPEMFLHVSDQRDLIENLLKFTNVKYLLAFTQSPSILSSANKYEFSTSGMLNCKVLKGE